MEEGIGVGGPNQSWEEHTVAPGLRSPREGPGWGPGKRGCEELNCRQRTEPAPRGSPKPPRHFREEDVCAAGALSYSSAAKKIEKKKKAWETLGRIVSKPSGEAQQPKKGRGKKKLRCLQRKKKLVEKVTGRSSPFEGWLCAVPWGGPVALTDLGGESHSVSHPATLHPAAQAPAQPSKGPLRSARCRLCRGIALIHCLPA